MQKREREREFAHIKVCSEPTEMHCSNGLGKMHSQLFSAAVTTSVVTQAVVATTASSAYGHHNVTMFEALFEPEVRAPSIGG